MKEQDTLSLVRFIRIIRIWAKRKRNSNLAGIQLNCFIFVCKKSKLKEGLKRWTNQAFWFLSSILTSPKNILTPRSHACFPCRTGGHTHNPPLEKRTRFKTNYYIYAYVATQVQLRTQQCESMCVEFYATKQWGRTQLFTCYMSPAQRHLQLMGAITANGVCKNQSLYVRGCVIAAVAWGIII